MKTKNLKKLKGHVAVVTSDGQRIDCYPSHKVALSPDEAYARYTGFVNVTAPQAIPTYDMSENSYESRCSHLWEALLATFDQGEFWDYFPEFAEDVIAVLGSGCYIFDYSGAVQAPHKVSRKNYDDFMLGMGFEHNPNKNEAEVTA
jgi:hypothetical protein